MSIKNLLTRTQKALTALRPECPGFGKTNRLWNGAEEGSFTPTVCPVCGGCHTLQVEEVIWAAEWQSETLTAEYIAEHGIDVVKTSDGRELSSAEFLAEKATAERFGDE